MFYRIFSVEANGPVCGYVSKKKQNPTKIIGYHLNVFLFKQDKLPFS